MSVRSTRGRFGRTVIAGTALIAALAIGAPVRPAAAQAASGYSYAQPTPPNYSYQQPTTAYPNYYQHPAATSAYPNYYQQPAQAYPYNPYYLLPLLLLL